MVPKEEPDAWEVSEGAWNENSLCRFRGPWSRSMVCALVIVDDWVETDRLTSED